MTIRYMGTKRHMVEHVRAEILDLTHGSRAVDLFSGMGSVAESLGGTTTSVVTNDALSFTSCFSRARFTGPRRTDPMAVAIARVRPKYQEALKAIESEFGTQLKLELKALDGDREALAQYVEGAKHVAASPIAARQAKAAAAEAGMAHYRLTSLYFSAGYLSLRQAIEADALRFAIDQDRVTKSRDWLIASWLAAVSVVLNAPGHTAQHLRPNSDSAQKRMIRMWNRSIWDEFEAALARTRQVGTSAWRKNNETFVSDALDLISGGELESIGVVYADPPYTKDQYSRYYHLYETLYRYDYPDSHGAGRVRSDRFSTGFSLKSSVQASFHDLCRNVSRMEVPLVVSYPAGGLLEHTGTTVEEVAREHFSNVRITSITAKHSTMGASSGSSKKIATENLYVCT